MKSGGMVRALGALLLIALSAQAQQWDWVRRFSSVSAGTAIGVDASDNVYLAGVFSGTNYLGTNEFASAGGNDLFLLKLTPDGDVAWAISTGGPLNDSIHRVVVASNGALFVVGNFTIRQPLLAPGLNQTGDATNVFLARIDDGKFTWFDTLPPDSPGLGAIIGMPAFGFQSGLYGVGGVAFGPGESLWIIAATNMPFIRKYHQDGTLLHGVALDTYFRPNGIAVSPDERVFVTGLWPDNTYFTGGLDASGHLIWSWNAGKDDQFHEIHPIYDIAATADSGVVSVAAIHSGFNWRGVIIKHAADGSIAWRRDKWIYYKSVFSPRALSIDEHGRIQVIGRQVMHYLYPQQSDGLWLLTLDANGGEILESTVSGRDFRFPVHTGTDIAVAASGAICITGHLIGSAFFGTNEVWGGGAFVARRSTLTPQLTSGRVGDQIVFSWPRAAFPFALQQSDVTGTNWSFVSQPPERVGTGWQVILSGVDPNVQFRLFRTNEAPIRYPPRVNSYNPGGSRFLQHESAVLLPRGTGQLTRQFSASVSADGAKARMTFDILDGLTGEPLTPTRTFDVNAYIPFYPPTQIICFCANVTSGAVNLLPGQHNLTLRISDGVDVTTNSLQYEVITFEAALEELRTALEPLSATRTGRHALGVFDAALRAEERNRPNLATKRSSHFQRGLARITALTEEERTLLYQAAEQIRSLF